VLRIHCRVNDVFNQELRHWVELPPGLGLAAWNLLWTWYCTTTAAAANVDGTDVLFVGLGLV
jgi:hypothetical protein